MSLVRLKQAFLAAISLILGITPALGALPKVPEGFEIRLVAAVPAVEFPCQVATAPDGSLFIAEDPMDQVGPANKPIDRILLFREGKEPVVFAETLNAVFGMAYRDGSLYVMNMPNLTVLRDTDGDGKADQRKELFKDLGVPAGEPNMFNDHIVSGLQFGIDGYLYISVGDKGVPKATGPDGRTAQVFGGGILRCRPDGTRLEVYSSGTRNHLEPNLDARDNLFTYDNTDDGLGWWTRVTHHIDGGYYGYPWDYHDRTDRMLNRMAEYGGGSPCGGLVYKEDVWPEKYRGRAFWTEWAKRVVRAIDFAPDGASYKVANESDFVTPGDVGDFRPLDLALSYDGRTMYIADWGMGGWGSKTERLGRVYAVTYKGDVKTRPRGHDSEPVDAQIEQLNHPSFNERTRAQAALIKVGKGALGAALASLADSKTDPLAKRHLIWVVDAIAGGTPEGTAELIAALKSTVADIRSQAARALGERGVGGAVDPLIATLKDVDPSVRLQAIIALGRIGQNRAIRPLIPFVADTDLYLAFSARRAIQRIGDWKEAARGLDANDAKIRAGLLLAMEMIYDIDAASALARFASDPLRDPEERARALFLLAQGHRKPIPWDGKWWGTQPANTKPPAKSVDWAGTTLVLATVRDRLSDPSVPVRMAAAKAAKETIDQAASPLLRDRFVAEKDVEIRKEIARVLGALGDKASIPLLVAAIKDAKTPEAVRDESLAAVEAIGDDAALKALLGILEAGALDTEKQPRLIAALGRFKTSEAQSTLLRILESPSPSVRAAGAEALGKIGKIESAGPIRKLLGDKSLDVRKGAIAALAAIKDRESIPGLIDAANSAETRFEATLALAALPDAKALSVYLRGLVDKSPDLRKACSSALAMVRDDAVPVLEQLASRKELPSTVLPELREIYTRVRPIQYWHILGPLPFKTEPPFPVAGPLDLKARFPGFKDEPLGWQTAKAIDGKGQINLGELLHTNDDDLSAFAYAEISSLIDRKASFSAGSDDTLTVWINGEKVYDFQDRRSYNPEEAKFDAALSKGVNRVLVKCGNRGGGWQFGLAIAAPSDYAFLQGPAPGAFDPEAYRKFAQSAEGQAERGKSLFADLKGLACVKCHAVGGQGGAVGPELTSVGAKYPKDELISAVLYPSSKISSGYEPVVIATADGKVVTGIVKGETAESVEVEDVDAKRIKIAKSEIDERKRSDVSLMPNGLAEGLTRQDFADLIAYLGTLKDKEIGAKKPASGDAR